MSRASKLLFVAVIVLLCGNLAFAQSDIGLKGVGAKIGFVAPEDPIESTIGFGAVADLGTITPAIHLGAFVDFWKKSYDTGSLGGTFEASFTEIAIGALGKYYFPMSNSAFKPYAGAGLGLTIGKAKVDSPYGGGSDSSTDFGFRILGGADYALSPTLTGFAEAVYQIDGADYFGIFAGVVYSLGK